MDGLSDLTLLHQRAVAGSLDGLRPTQNALQVRGRKPKATGEMSAEEVVG